MSERSTAGDEREKTLWLGLTERWVRWQPRAVFVIPVVVYLLLVLFGVTNSNIGIDSLRQDPADPHGLQIGTSQAVRGDEYGTESPIWLGELARGGQDAVTPLTVSNDFFAQLPDGPVSAVVFFDGTALTLGQWIPHEMLFAAKWWLPTLLLFLGLPVWFRQLTGRLRWGYLAAFLTVVAPASMWWSGRPVNTLGFVAAGCALAIYGARRIERRSWAVGIVAILGSGILLARFPTYYQPLAIVVGIPLILATATYLLWRPVPLRRSLLSLALIAVSGAAWTGLIFWENRDAIAAGLATVYPGFRTSTGESMDIGLVFGAPSLGFLKLVQGSATLPASEFVTSFTVLLLVLAMLFAAARWRGERATAAALIPIVGLAVFWLSWATLNWGTLGSLIPLVNRVPNSRAAQGVGYLAVIAFCLFMSQWRPKRRIATAGMAGALTLFVTGYAGSQLQDSALPGLTVWMVWLSAALAGAVVFVVVQWTDRWWSLLVAAVAAASLTFTASPILFGLGDLRASETAHQFMAWGEQARADGTVWATDSQSLDSLLTATGTPSLSVRQQVGPDMDAWRRLDPDADGAGWWNRGGLHITFDWTDDDEVTITQPVADVVILHGSPCAVAEAVPELTHIASSHDLSAPCLTGAGTVQWSGETFHVYDVAAP
ncbi:hypothetical protein G3N18_07720 [Microbacterium sp. 2C]|uniref:DUF7657 domain-containing protein n=1 Tax=Microbacterium paulum TaxID=2707006 RepID=UPI0018C1DAE5|nr:hypothetical protein [Microbacterium paulum]MBG0717960.1 hypothetical protein [Microbacterium paulum]